MPIGSPEIADVFGYAGTVLNVVWPLFRRRTAMLAGHVGVNGVFATHYALLGASTGAWMNVLGLIQALLAIPLGTRPGFRLAYLVTLPCIATTLALSWAGWPSLCAALGMTLVSLGRYQTRPQAFRILLLLAVVPWIAHNLLVTSIPGLVSDAAALTSGALMLRVTRRSAVPRPAPP